MSAAALPRTLELSSQSLWPLYSLVATGLVTVICIAGAALSQVSQRQTHETALATERAVARVQLLRATLPSGVVGAASAVPRAAGASAPVASGPVPPVIVATAVATAIPAPTRPAPASTPKVTRTPPKPASAVLVAQSTQNSQGASEAAAVHRGSPPPSASAPAPAPAPVALVTPDMVASAKNSNKIEGIDGARLGVSKIGTDAVFLKNGSNIKIGGKFPSGEVLLQLDPDNGQIVTTKRTLLVF